MPAVPDSPQVAYFSMEVGLLAGLPTYSGGLGVLAGDTLRAAADSGVPMVGVTLVHRKGYFRQRLDAEGNQTEEPDEWDPASALEELRPRVTVELEGRPVRVRAWRHALQGLSGARVFTLFLDTDLAENSVEDRTLTDQLYRGDSRHRLRQEAVLGLGGVAMLRALGHEGIATFHMNEGHSALLALALLEEQVGDGLSDGAPADQEAVRGHCVFTTHTPVPAGHDRFPLELVREVLGDERANALAASGCCPGDELNMTHLALAFSRYVNGVAMRHGQVSRGMFPNYPINSITNGVHAVTWTSVPFRALYDRHVPEWRFDNLNLRHAVGIPLHEIRSAHEEAKRQLLVEVEKRARAKLRPDVFTVGFARRATAYKRADLLFADVERLRRIAREVGPIQILYAGKAHPKDEGGKAMIRRIFEAAASLQGDAPVVYLENYDMTLGERLTAGVDLWLNTPQKPQEASGTSGMKAALNGVPSLSVLDGWWIEGHVEGVTGWSIGDGWEAEADARLEARSLYDKLELRILPAFYGKPKVWDGIMRSAIALNGSFFNAQRMVQQYVESAYRPVAA